MDQLTEDIQKRYGKAMRYVERGLSVIPIRTDGSMAPAIPDWQTYRTGFVDPQTLKEWMQAGFGIGIITGKVSGNLEVLEVEDAPTVRRYITLIKASGAHDFLKRLVIVTTPSGGWQMYYRCAEIFEESQSLALRGDGGTTNRVILKTHAEGGYVLAPGSPPECHVRLKPYEKHLGAFAEIPTLSAEERALLLSVARSMNECEIQPAASSQQSTSVARPHKVPPEVAPDRPVDAPAHAPTQIPPAEAPEAGAAPAEISPTEDPTETVTNEEFDPVPDGWPPPLEDAALYGLAGRIVNAILPHTESDPAALLFQFLAAFGNVIGSGAYRLIEADKHPPRFFIMLVGETSKGRKGAAWGRICRLFEAVAPEWAAHHIESGLNSGEGLIWKVRDGGQRVGRSKKSGDSNPAVLDPGVEDKRLLVVESEFAGVLKVMRRDGNTLSPVIRSAWDTGNLCTLVKNSPAKATAAHVSIIGHITRDEVRRLLDEVEQSNGFGNRFLWVCVRRSKMLPEGGRVPEDRLQPLIAELEKAVEFGRQPREVTLSQAARPVWEEIYREEWEGRPGLAGAMTARSPAQMVRLALIYAVLDLSSEVRPEHLYAARAAWKYCKESVDFIFGDALGNSTADRILEELRKRPEGMTLTQIYGIFGRHTNQKEVDRALRLLERLDLARMEKKETGGRPGEVWFAP